MPIYSFRRDSNRFLLLYLTVEMSPPHKSFIALHNSLAKHKKKAQEGPHQKAARILAQKIGVLTDVATPLKFQHQRRGKTTQHSTVHEVEFVDSIPLDKSIFVGHLWNGHDELPSIPKITVKNVKKEGTCKQSKKPVELWLTNFYKKFDTDEENHSLNMVVVDNATGNLLCAKISRRQTKEISVEYWDSVRVLMKDVRKAKPNISRGEDCYGMSDKYICFGQRKEPKGKKIGEYSFVHNVPLNVRHQFTKGIQELISKMEGVGQRLIHHLPDTELFQKLRKSCDLKSVGEGMATQVQFSIGYQYWSKVHCDQDYFYTLLSCLSGDSKDHSNILYYFCFPEYDFMVPMRSGDLLWFNPLVEHCCTNSSTKEGMIFSAYVSKKTVQTIASDKFKTNN
jgi:hypothetical protein